MKVIVVGAGIIGAMIARHLDDRAEVLMVDAGRAGATRASFGWINASFHLDRAHYDLRVAAMRAWRKLDLGAVWSGALWFEQQGAELEAFHARLQGLGYEVAHMRGADLSAALGPLRHGPAEALLFPQEGYIETGPLLERLGGQVMRGVAVQRIVERHGRVCGIAVEGGVIEADHVVIAAGIGSAALAESVGVPLPMVRRPGVMVRSRPVAAALPHVMVAPGLELRSDEAGRVLVPTSPQHQADEAAALEEPADVMAQSALARAEALLGFGLQAETIWAAERPVPGDGRPVIGPAGPDGLWWAVLHSGVTLAPIVAQGIANGLLDGAEPGPLLAPYAPSRFVT